MALLHRAPDALARRVLRGLMVLTATDDEPFVITPPGDVIWELLADPIAIEDLVETLTQTFEGETARIRADVTALVEMLVEKGAVVVA